MTRYTIDYDAGGAWRVRAQHENLRRPFRFVAESRPGALQPRKQFASCDCPTDAEAIAKAIELAEQYSHVEG